MFNVLRIDFPATEFCWAILAGLGLALITQRQIRRGHSTLRTIGQWPMVLPMMAAVFMFLIQLQIAQAFGWPVPALHDEFSYLLAADTFASGRATNPTHPAWEFLETYHVLWQPTYQSKYPPGNGLVLALGQALTGAPIIGEWICLGACAGLTCWMLKGWFSTVWSVVGASFLIFNWPITKLWGQTYYGGGPALMGGLLLFGGIGRLQRGPRFGPAICASLGLIILAITRPYEGLLTSLPVSLMFVVRVLRAPVSQRAKWRQQVIFPAAIILGGGAMGLAWYHQQVTGNPWTWPYRLYEATYSRRTNALNTIFAFTEQGTRTRTIPSLEYESSAGEMRVAATKPWLYAFWKLVRLWWFHVGLLASIPLVFALLRSLFQAMDRWKSATQYEIPLKHSRRCSSGPTRLAWLTLVLVTAAILLQRTAGHPHYAAPVLPLILILIVAGLRQIRAIRIGKIRVGPLLVSWLVYSVGLAFGLPILTGASRPNIRPWSQARQRIEQTLAHRSKKQLAIVRYGPRHSMHEEWIANRADIDAAAVVWARDLGPARFPELLKIFADRDVWIIEPDTQPVRMTQLR